jgi:hypothetical protein
MVIYGHIKMFKTKINIRVLRPRNKRDPSQKLFKAANSIVENE